MVFESYRIIYFNILLFMFFLFNQFFFFFLFVYFKLPIILNCEHENEYQFDYGYCDYDDVEHYREFDIDDEFMYTLIHMESYMLLNCRFSFDLYGGDTVLDHLDFLDFEIYKHQEDRNKKYVYQFTQMYEKVLDEKLFKLQIEYKGNYNELSYIKNLDINQKNNIYNIMDKQELKKMLTEKLRYRYIKKM